MSGNLGMGSAKILVLGDSGVGKSSLIHLICRSSVLSSAHCTIGCSIDVKLFDNYFLEFWEVGGSRSHKIARSFLYQDYQGIMLVFDTTNKKSRLNLSEWLMEVTHKNNERDLESFLNIDIPILSIATKKDLLPYESYSEYSDSSHIYNGKYCSVVNMNGSSDTNYPHRRHQSSAYAISPLITSNSESHSNLCDLLLDNQVIHVNTQDPLSLLVGTQNYVRLESFFRHVVQKNRKIYNKFAI